MVPVSAPDEFGAPVSIDTDVWVPDGTPPSGGWPVVALFHGGGGDKASQYDSDRAKWFAERGYFTFLYSARGHGASGGQVTVAGPKEVRDAFDVLAWALKTFPIDRSKIVLWGISQGGLHTNLLQAWAADRTLNPTGISFRALIPGNTPDRTFEALVEHQRAVKLSFGVGLIGTYIGGTRGKVAPIVDKWIATAGADVPATYGSGDVCDFTGHDTPSSTMKQDLAARSVGCFASRYTLPAFWAQSFDDELFTVDMALTLPTTRLYLSMGGHGAPASVKSVELERFEEQAAFLDHVIRGAPLRGPRVVYWSRDPAVVVPAGAKQYPERAWVRQEAPSWPPPGVVARSFPLGSSDRPLSPVSEDTRNDPVVASAIGTSPPSTRAGDAFVWESSAFDRDTELSGPPSVRASWTPAGREFQLVAKFFAVAPDGTHTLMTRGIAGVRDAVPGTKQDVVVRGRHTSVLLRRGYKVAVWITAGDTSFYKAYPAAAGGMLGAGASSVTLPLRTPSPAAACGDTVPPSSSIAALRVTRRALRVRGRASDTGCAGAVRRVRVAVARESGRRCRFLQADGRFSGARSCHRTSYLDARGSARWSFSLRGRFARGRYKLWSRAVDTAGNVERKASRRNLARARARR